MVSVLIAEMRFDDSRAIAAVVLKVLTVFSLDLGLIVHVLCQY